MSKGFASNYRIVLLATVLLVGFAGLGMRLISIQVVDRDDLLRNIAKARRQIIEENARRGDILDRNENILATSHSLMVLAVDPWDLREADEPKWPQLAALIGMPLPELRKILTTKFRPAAAATPAAAGSPAQPPADLVINFKMGSDAAALSGSGKSAAEEKIAADEPAKNEDSISDGVELDEPDATGLRKIRYAKLSSQVTEAVFTKIENLGIKGVLGNRIYRRAYPHAQLAAHVIGFVNNAQQPATGIEHYADFYLRGQNGWRESEKDGLRRELAQFRSREVPRVDGYKVKLSLDCNVQDIIEQELAYIAQKFQPEKATIIVSDPRDGFILGMANYPTFDLNDYGKVPKEAQASMKNIAVTDTLEPGSTFKIVSISAGLEEGVITPNDRFDCTLERVEYSDGRMANLPREDSADHFDHPLNIAEIVAHSSNKGAAQIGLKLGATRLYDYARAFGFGRPLGFPTGGEVTGIVNKPDKDPAKWSLSDLTRVPMGHAISATALQMHQAMCTIATGGVLLRPQIVREIKDSSDQVVYKYDRVEVGRAVSERTAKIMAEMLMGVTAKNCTGANAAIPGYEVAGKTGTTQMIIDGKYSDKHHVASFVGFFPASNPQIAISVIVHDADARAGGVAFGAKVAAPSFKRIGEQLITYRGITPPVSPATMAPAAKSAFALEGGRR